MSKHRVLLLLDQLPHDPASGAARTCKTICEFLAADDSFAVQALATTATEKGGGVDAQQHLDALGLDITKFRSDDPNCPELWRFVDRGVTYFLMKSTHTRNTEWEADEGGHFDRYFEHVVHTFRPDAIFTHGGHAQMIARWARVRRTQGVKVVFGLWNHAYLEAQAMFEQTDAVLTPSRFLTDKYRRLIGLDSTSLPSPIDFDDVVASEREPTFLTVVNPSIEKGMMFTARFAEELSKQRPDIPLLIVESRGTAEALLAAGVAGGFDLRRHDNIMVSPGVSAPRDFFAVTRVLLAPSVWEEPSGRVASEALVNGVPPVVSDRGGLPEECRGAGVVLPLPKELTLETGTPVAPAAVQPWIDACIRFVDDEGYYAQQSERARAAGREYQPEVLRERYVGFFESVLSGRGMQAGEH